MPSGYQIQIGGEYYKTKAGFKNLVAVMGISTFAIFPCSGLSIQKCDQAAAVVLAAAPYGMVGAFSGIVDHGRDRSALWHFLV